MKREKKAASRLKKKKKNILRNIFLQIRRRVKTLVPDEEKLLSCCASLKVLKEENFVLLTVDAVPLN